MTAQTASGRFCPASSVAALVAGGLVLALVVVDVRWQASRTRA